MDGANALRQALIGLGVGGRRSTAPGRVAGARRAEHPIGERDGVLGRVGRDEPVAAHRVALSRAKKAAAFLRISRSSLSTATSRRRRANSAFSSVVSPSRWPASISACLTRGMGPLASHPRVEQR
jgi:hypothetical protein